MEPTGRCKAPIFISEAVTLRISAAGAAAEPVSEIRATTNPTLVTKRIDDAPPRFVRTTRATGEA